MLKRAFLLMLITVVLLSLLTACGGKTATTPAATTPATITQPTTTTTAATTNPPATETQTATQPVEKTDNDVTVAVKMANILYDIVAVQDYYDDGLTAMATFQVEQTSSVASNPNGKTAVFLADISVKNFSYSTIFKMGYSFRFSFTVASTGKKKVPQEFMDKIPPGGAMPAPAGACPAAAEPAVTFMTKGGDAVTPELLEEKDIQSIPTELVSMAQDDPKSLVSIIENMVPMNDIRLGTADGWNTLLWDKLESLREPAESVMDYQLWNAASDIEQQIASLYRQRLVASGAPQRVIDAFDNSNTSGWYANSEATPDDALAQMDIEAEMTGSVNGMVHEQRDFTIRGASQTPEYGPQTGDGTVTWDLPGVGLMTFEVDILLDQFDGEGRAIGGTVMGVDAEKDYTIRFDFLPDGSKKGELFQGGESAGLLTMTTNAEKFENYIDVKTNETTELVDDGHGYSTIRK